MVKYFQKTSALGPSSLSQLFTEKLKDKFLSQTSLKLTDKNADLVFEGSISNYMVTPLAIQANETAAKNRLTITITVKFTNITNEKQNFESSFSRFADFSSSQSLSVVETDLITEINDQLVDDVFNKAFINW
ncbi:MAG: LptE family protein [Bacteroidetes bacterium]|nr:LptE family protein [Bacteroidota bacterium]